MGLYCNFYSKNGVSIVHGIEPYGPSENFNNMQGSKLFNFDITHQEVPEEVQKKRPL